MRSPQSQILSFAIRCVPLAVVLTLAPNSFSISSAADSNSSGSNSVTPGKTITGKATIYPNRLNGHKTASGDTFHQSNHTAASNKLPLGTDVKVTSLRTGKSTNVKLIDRGPALGGHRIDLSKKAAREIGLTGKEGTVPVKIKVTHTPGGPEALPSR
jgi:rare lipoprotein A